MIRAFYCPFRRLPKTIYALHVYLTGVAAKAFSGNCALQKILN